VDFEFKKASKHNINIRHTVNGGCIIKVGCCEAAFSTPDEMLETLADYYKDPVGMEKRYNTSDPDGFGPEATDTGCGTSDPVGHALGHAPNRVTSVGSSIRDHQIEEAIDDGENCEEEGKMER
jgi:hypothetical protein